MVSPLEAQRRALRLFEQTSEGCDPAVKRRLLKAESPEVRAILAGLEASASRARDNFPTQEDVEDQHAPMALPERIGMYRLTELIGSGGMGMVFRGERDDGLFEHVVAIKLIHPERFSRVARSRFEGERRLLARLDHPAIARLIDGGVDPAGWPYIIMELVEGVPLDQWLREQAPSTGQAVAILAQVIEGVQAAHRALVIHGDIKPANIMVTRFHRVRLLDFGVGRFVDSQTQPQLEPRTETYASPQRRAGQAPEVTDDVYSLGRVIQDVLDVKAHPDLAAISAQALTDRAVDRYPSAEALAGDLDLWRRGFPVSAREQTRRYRAERFVTRHRIGVVVSAIAACALVVLSIVAVVGWQRAVIARQDAEARFNDVRHISGYVLFDLYDQLARQPGTVTKRAEIAATSARYLERLQLNRNAPADLRTEVAGSYRRLGEIQGYPGTSNLGRPEEAARSLGKAEALLRSVLADQPDNAPALAQLGWVLDDQWALGSDSPKTVLLSAEARVAFEKALAIAPKDASARLGLLACDRALAYDLIWTDDKPAQADAIARKALGTLRASRWPAALAVQAQTLELSLLRQIGDGIYYAGDVAGSLVPFYEAEARIDQLIASQGPTPNLLIAKALQDFNISGSLADMAGRVPESLVIAQRGATSMEQLLSAGSDAMAEKALIILYGQQASSLENGGQIARALLPRHKAIALEERRVERSPGDFQRTRDLAIGLIQYARLLGKAGRHAEACAAITRDLDLWRALEVRGELGAHDGRKEIAKAVAVQENDCVGTKSKP